MEKETSRTEAFSDGIFAVAITLLSIEIGVDIKDIEAHHPLQATTNKELLQQLTMLWPKLFSYFNSFASVLLMWITHHQIFKQLRSINNKLLISNGLLLLVIALVPFPTKTMGDFLLSDARQTAILFYTGYAVLLSLGFVLFITIAKSHNGKLLQHPAALKKTTYLSKQLWVGLYVNTAIFGISFFAPVAGLVLTFCMWFFWAITAKGD